jgi:hypothetical protein
MEFKFRQLSSTAGITQPAGTEITLNEDDALGRIAAGEHLLPAEFLKQLPDEWTDIKTAWDLVIGDDPLLKRLVDRCRAKGVALPASSDFLQFFVSEASRDGYDEWVKTAKWFPRDPVSKTFFPGFPPIVFIQSLPPPPAPSSDAMLEWCTQAWHRQLRLHFFSALRDSSLAARGVLADQIGSKPRKIEPEHWTGEYGGQLGCYMQFNLYKATLEPLASVTWLPRFHSLEIARAEVASRRSDAKSDRPIVGGIPSIEAQAREWLKAEVQKNPGQVKKWYRDRAVKQFGRDLRGRWKLGKTAFDRRVWPRVAEQFKELSVAGRKRRLAD